MKILRLGTEQKKNLLLFQTHIGGLYIINNSMICQADLTQTDFCKPRESEILSNDIILSSWYVLNLDQSANVCGITTNMRVEKIKRIHFSPILSTLLSILFFITSHVSSFPI